MKNCLYSVIFLIVFGSACGFRYDQRSEDFRLEGPVDYARVLTVVLTPKCLGCHSTATDKNRNSAFADYDSTLKWLEHIKIRALVERTMPSDMPLNAEQSAVLKVWIENGAPLRVNSPVKEPTTGLTATWKSVSENIYAKRCGTCHIPPEPAGDFDITSLPANRQRALKLFDYLFVSHEDLPHPKLKRLNAEETKVMGEWLATELPE